MSIDKPKIILAMTEDLVKRIDDYRFGNRISSRSEAIRRLIEEGLRIQGAEKDQQEKEI
jgi:metal-responsive CopG/Arc/MetJ family transcriptional regulator